MCLVATARKLGISFFEYISDRIISQVGNIPYLGTISFRNNLLLTFLLAHRYLNKFFPRGI
jgi:hypothetical protein